MGNAVVTIKLMPESPDVKLGDMEAKIVELIDAFAKNPTAQKKIELEPVAFGIVALKVMFLMNEDIGSPDALEVSLGELDGVQNAEVTDVRRALG